MPNPYYPKIITLPDGRRTTVNDHIVHGRKIGREVLPDGTVCGVPTLDEVRAAGYADDVAPRIVAREQRIWDAQKELGVSREEAAEIVARDEKPDEPEESVQPRRSASKKKVSEAPVEHQVPVEAE